MINTSEIKQTVLHQSHVDAGAKMVPFAGYDMPVSYPMGIIKEHLHTRENAGLFDVSHMGQISVSGPQAALHLESLIPVDIVSLETGQQKYGLFLNDDGGVLDDLMIARIAKEEFILVVNAACKYNDFEYLKMRIGNQVKVEMIQNQSLLALQGPKSAEVMRRLGYDFSDMGFMSVRKVEFNGYPCIFTRSGYTGEDGFEMSMHDQHAAEIARLLLNDEDVEWVGLGARDSLRMEAGLSLYGHEITELTTPIEASLLWAISKPRRTGGERSGGFPGDHIILPQIQESVSRKLVGLQPSGKAPIREGAIIKDNAGDEIGIITSGGFSPSLGKPISIGYVNIHYSKVDTQLNAIVRGKSLPMTVAKLPFVPQRYYRI